MKYFILVVLIVNSLNVICDQSLYDVMGVPRSASSQEIKRAYKKLARTWHPDKNQDPSANQKFMKINEAYEVLSDPKKRHEYDTFGHVVDNPSEHHGHNHHGFRGHPAEDIFEFLNPFGGGGGFGGGRFSFSNLEATNYRHYKLTLVPASRTRPVLLLGYSDFCMPCRRLIPLWMEMEEKLKPLGVELAAVNLGMDGAMRDQLRVFHTPTIMAVINERVTYYRGGSASLQSMLDFLRGALPSDLVNGPIKKISDIEIFLNDWPRDGKVRAILAKPLELPSMRFMIAAFKYREHIASGFINIEASESAEFNRMFHVPSNQESLLIFKENPKEPVTIVSSGRLEVSTMNAMMGENLYLVVPRLSSERVLDNLCPAQMRYEDKKVCLIFLVEDPGEEGVDLGRFREMAHEWEGQHRSNVQPTFLYAYVSIQKAFLGAFTESESSDQLIPGRVVAIWRQASREAVFHWLPTVDWTSVDNFIQSQSSKEGRSLWSSRVVELPALVDEFLAPLHVRILKRSYRLLQDWWDYMYPYLSEPTVLMALAFFGWLMLVLFWSVRSLSVPQPKRPNARGQQRTQSNGQTKYENGTQRNYPTRPVPLLESVELRPGNYARIVAKAPQGQLTVLLCITRKNTNKIISEFGQILGKFGSQYNMVGSHVYVDEWPAWFAAMLHPATLVPPEELTLRNMTNCAGTVFALNSFRRYFSLYHPKIPAAMRGRNRKTPRTVNPMSECLGLDGDDGLSSEMSTDSENEMDDLRDSDNEPMDPLSHPEVKLFEADLLSGLPNWLDRLFEGSLNRIRVDNWPPEMMSELPSSGLGGSGSAFKVRAPLRTDLTDTGTLSDRIFPASSRKKFQ